MLYNRGLDLFFYRRLGPQPRYSFNGILLAKKGNYLRDLLFIILLPVPKRADTVVVAVAPLRTLEHLARGNA